MNYFSPVKRLNKHFKDLEKILKFNDYFLGIKNYRNNKIKKNENIDFIKKFAFDFGYLEFSFFNIDDVRTTNDLSKVSIDITFKYKNEYFKNNLNYHTLKEMFNVLIFDIKNEQMFNVLMFDIKNEQKNQKFNYENLFNSISYKFSLKLKKVNNDDNNGDDDSSSILEDNNEELLKSLILRMTEKKEKELGIPEIKLKLNNAKKEYDTYEKISKESLDWKEKNKDKIYLYNKDYEKNIVKHILDKKFKELNISDYYSILKEKENLLNEYLKGVSDCFNHYCTDL